MTQGKTTLHMQLSGLLGLLSCGHLPDNLRSAVLPVPYLAGGTFSRQSPSFDAEGRAAVQLPRDHLTFF